MADACSSSEKNNGGAATLDDTIDHNPWKASLQHLACKVNS
jgi:hypothetical protein